MGAEQSKFGTGSPFQKAEALTKRLKLLVYGATGTGKTTLALKFPGVAMLDMDAGADLYEGDHSIMRAADADSAMAAVDWLLTEKHEHRTLAIDPATIYWDALQKKWSDIFLARNKSGKGFKFEFYELQPKDWMTLKAEHKEFFRKVSLLDMNVVATAREKILYSDDGGMKKLGDTFDGEKSLPYLFDVVLRLHRGPKGEYLATTIKDRTGKLPTGTFPNDFAVFADAFGMDNLSKPANQNPLATEDQKSQIVGLAGILALSDERLLAGLRGFAKCEGWDDLTEAGAKKVIEILTTQVKRETANA